MRALLKAGRVETEDIWFGKAFQIFEATDENDLEAATVVSRGGTQIDRHEEERSIATAPPGNTIPLVSPGKHITSQA